jgi:hypothetical protein
MGAPIIGRTPCPECGFGGAHVKESPKCIFRYCPDCGSQYHARTGRQRELLLAKTRSDTPTGSEPTTTPTPEPTQAPKPAPGPAAPTPSEPTASEPKPIDPPTPTPAPRKRIGLFPA